MTSPKTPTPPEFSEAFAANLSAAIEAAETTPALLAEALGVHYTTIWKYLTGKMEPRAGVVIAMAEALDIDTHDLWPCSAQLGGERWR